MKFKNYFRLLVDKYNQLPNTEDKTELYTVEILQILLSRNKILEDAEVTDKKKLDQLISEYASKIIQEQKENKKSILLRGTKIPCLSAYNEFRSALMESNALAINVVFSKNSNDELVCKFASEINLKRFVDALGGVKQFSADHPRFPEQLSPMILAQDPTTLYIHTYTAANGEVAAVFPSIEIRNRFFKLFNLKEYASINPEEEALFMNDKTLHYHNRIYVSQPDCCSNVGYRNLMVDRFFEPSMPKEVVNIINEYNAEQKMELQQ